MDYPFETLTIVLAVIGVALSVALIIFFVEGGGLYKIVEFILGIFR